MALVGKVSATFSRLALPLYLTPAVLGLLCFFVAPTLWLFRLSLYSSAPSGSGFYVADSLTLQHYADVLSDPYFRNLGAATLKLGLAVTAAAMLTAYPLAVYLYRARPAIKAGVLLAVLLPKFSNVLVGMYGVLVLLANSGPINRFLLWTGLINAPLPMFASLFAVVVGETLVVAPYPVLILASALHGVDRGLEDAARGLGASPLRAFYEVPFKLTLPSLALAALVTLIWALGAFTAPLVLGNPEWYPVGVEVYSRTFEDANWPLGATLAVSNLIMVGVIAAAALAVHGALEKRLGR